MFNIKPVDGRTVFVDTETTALDGHRRRPWEIATIIRDPGKPDVEIEWQLRPDLTDADPDSLRIGRYYRRNRILNEFVGNALTIVSPDLPELQSDVIHDVAKRRTYADVIAVTLTQILDGAYIVGKVPSFDELCLDGFMREAGQVLTTHHRLTCVGTLALGYLHGKATALDAASLVAEAKKLRDEIPPPPWDPKELSRLVGVEPIRSDLAHRALVDARWARDVHDAVTGYKPPTTSEDDEITGLAATGEIPVDAVAK